MSSPRPLTPKLKADLVAVSRRIHELGWVANHDGNVSVRLSGNRFLCTPTAVSKRDVDADLLIVVDAAGKVLEGRRKPFGELELHLAAYRARPDVQAVLHAHPPHATAFGLLGLELGPVAMPEIVVSLGEQIPLIPRLMPKTDALVKAVEGAAAKADAMLLGGNGALTVADELSLTLLRMELVEHYAKILTVARTLGGTVPELSSSELEPLRAARFKAFPVHAPTK